VVGFRLPSIRDRPLPSPWTSLAPIRGELFGVERLEDHARSLAASQTITPKTCRINPLAARLTDNATVLLDAYRVLAGVETTAALTPAAEWLLDNYHVVEKQVHAIRTDLPPRCYRQLPKLEDGPFSGYPRVLGLAWAYIAHTDSRLALRDHGGEP
jgi:cyclic beta-1,2-glucan synthetase